jgi:hypothetical protein
MAAIPYNIKRLFMEYFGINIPVYVIPQSVQNSPVLSYKGLEPLPQSYLDAEKGALKESVPMSWMGTPIVFSASFQGGSYNRYRFNGETEAITMADFRLPAATMFSFRRAKVIERTNLLGSNGTVKEIFGLDDWIIDVRGICLNEPNQTAMEQYERLLEWERIVSSIGINGYLFNQKEIDAVVINEWNDNVVQGKPDTIPFSFQLYSDEPVELVMRQ